MGKTIEWQNHKIELNSFISPKYLMFAGETLLKVDGKELARTGGFHFSERACSTFLHEGKPVKIEINLQGRFFNINYILRVAEEPVSEGKIYLQKLGWACLLWALIGLILGSLAIILFQRII